MAVKDLMAHLQNRAEEIVTQQLSEFWKYKLFDVKDKKPFAPDMIVQKRNGDPVHLCVQGTDSNTGITSRGPHWKDSCCEFADKEGFPPHFLEMVILDRQGKGHQIFIRGLMELRDELRSPAEKIHKGRIMGISDQKLSDLKETINFQPGERKKKYYEEMAAVNQLESNRYLREFIQRTKGKPTDEIPDGDYCYTTHIPEDKINQYVECERENGPNSGESIALYIELSVETLCPYREWSNYGTVKCHFLEEEAVGLSDEAYQQALAHYGSKEKLEEECQGSMLLADAVRCCKEVLETIRNGCSPNKD